MDAATVMRSLARITHEIIEQGEGTEDTCILGVKNRGTALAEILCENIYKFGGKTVPCGCIDVTPYRDDYSAEEKLSRASGSKIPCDISGKTVIIVDDVIYTGRTARAAIEAVFALGRPKAVRLAALIDRGHREIPVRPDFVGKNIPTSRRETVRVIMEDCENGGVYIISEN